MTGSVFKAVCRTSPQSPSISTIERICFPEKNLFKSNATDWGNTHESQARAVYIESMQLIHRNLQCRLTGLIINNDYPFCGVSPDGIISCDCCGKGVLEIKCPYLMKFGETEPYLRRAHCPLIVDENSDYSLDVKHEYYYQVQMELYITNSDFCDFVVWNPRSSITVRVYKDEGFWTKNYLLAETFFKSVILPELLGTYFSNKKRKNPMLRTK